MDYPKLPAAEVVLRREKLGLSVKAVARAVRVSEPTWERWERVDSAPAFVHFLLLYLESGAPLSAGTAAASSPRVLSDDPRVRFEAKVQPGENGCRLWTATARFKLRGQNVRPRKAAWYFAHGVLPDQDVLTTCGTRECVAVEHLTLGKQTGGRERIAPAVKSAILLELRGGKMTGEQLAEKYQVSAGTISALKRLTRSPRS